MMKTPGHLTFFVFALVITACQNSVQKDLLVALYEDLSVYHRPVSTNVELAQQYFDQGLALYYGFNHEAAILSFQQD